MLALGRLVEEQKCTHRGEHLNFRGSIARPFQMNTPPFYLDFCERILTSSNGH